MSLLSVEGLTAGYDRPVLTGVDLAVARGEILGVVGETGSGKTTLVRAIAGLVPVSGGRVVLDGTELTSLRGRVLRDFRRTGALQLVFQDPLRALDPDLTVSALVGEPLAITRAPDRPARVARAVAAAGLDPALADRTPGALSGGQRQRVLLARALVTEPRLLLCDEPVSALDAATRNQILTLFTTLRAAGTAIVLISHDLHSLAGVADRLAVLHEGTVAEEGPAADLLARPAHPYTRDLIGAAPSLRRARLTAGAR